MDGKQQVRIGSAEFGQFFVHVAEVVIVSSAMAAEEVVVPSLLLFSYPKEVR